MTINTGLALLPRLAGYGPEITGPALKALGLGALVGVLHPRLERAAKNFDRLNASNPFSPEAVTKYLINKDSTVKGLASLFFPPLQPFFARAKDTATDSESADAEDAWTISDWGAAVLYALRDQLESDRRKRDSARTTPDAPVGHVARTSFALNVSTPVLPRTDVLSGFVTPPSRANRHGVGDPLFQGSTTGDGNASGKPRMRPARGSGTLVPVEPDPENDKIRLRSLKRIADEKKAKMDQAALKADEAQFELNDAVRKFEAKWIEPRQREIETLEAELRRAWSPEKKAALNGLRERLLALEQELSQIVAN